jgi:hypothetical protein
VTWPAGLVERGGRNSDGLFSVARPGSETTSGASMNPKAAALQLFGVHLIGANAKTGGSYS